MRICVLIAAEFNTSDHSRNRAKSGVYGKAQSRREKVGHVWGPSLYVHTSHLYWSLLKSGWLRLAVEA